MSNSYFNRVKTSKNRIDDGSSIVECIDSDDHIYYIRANQHEYLVDLSFTANTVNQNQYTVDNYDIKLPTTGEFPSINFRADTIKYMNKVYQHLLPNFSQDWSNPDFVASDDNYIPSIIGGGPNLIISPNYDIKLRNLGINQYRDFDYINMINSTIVDPHKFKWVEGDNIQVAGTVFKNTPITYCNSLKRGRLSWGLPNIEVLLAIIDSGDLKNRLISHFRADDTKNIVIGLYTQYFLQVKSGSGFRISDIEVATSLNNIGSTAGFELLGYQSADFDSYASPAVIDSTNLINGNNKPTTAMGVKNLASRLGIVVDGTNRQLPMLIIPTAIIR